MTNDIVTTIDTTIVRCECGEMNVQLFRNSEGKLFAACPGCSVQIAIEYAVEAEARLETISQAYLALRGKRLRLNAPDPAELENFPEMAEAYICEHVLGEL